MTFFLLKRPNIILVYMLHPFYVLGNGEISLTFEQFSTKLTYLSSGEFLLRDDDFAILISTWTFVILFFIKSLSRALGNGTLSWFY